MPRPTPEHREIANRFTFHPANSDTGPQHDAVREDFRKLALKLARNLPEGRQKSLALTALEEGMHWANAAIACASVAAPAPVEKSASTRAAKTSERVAKTVGRRGRAATAKTATTPSRTVRRGSGQNG